MGCTVNHLLHRLSRSLKYVFSVRVNGPNAVKHRTTNTGLQTPNHQAPNSKQMFDIMMMAHIRFAFQAINFMQRRHGCIHGCSWIFRAEFQRQMIDFYFFCLEEQNLRQPINKMARHHKRNENTLFMTYAFNLSRDNLHYVIVESKMFSVKTLSLK